MTIKELKKEAKARLAGNWKIAILNLFLVGIVTTIINEVLLGIIGMGTVSELMSTFSEESLAAGTEVATTTSLLSSLATVVVSMLTSVLVVGYDWSLLDMIDGKKLTVEGMFQTINGNRFFKVLGISVITTIFVFLWSLLLIIPGIVKSYSYSQAFNIYKDDPDIDIMGAINQSKEIMKGKKWDYFKLQFSFILWYLVPVIVLMAFIFGSINTIAYQFDQAAMGNEFFGFILGMIFVLLAFALVMFIISFYIEPYRKTATQIFYRDLVGFPDMDTDEVDYDDHASYSTDYIDPYDETNPSDHPTDFDDNEDRF